jgi:penicillin amidase
MKQMIAGQISNDNSLWWDNMRPIKETRSEILSQSLREAVTLEKQLEFGFELDLEQSTC